MHSEICMIFLVIISLIIVKESFAVFKYYKQLLGTHSEILQLNSNIFYNIEIEILYPNDTKPCRGLHIIVFNRQQKYLYKFKLYKKGRMWWTTFYRQSETRYIVGGYQYESQFKWSVSVSSWKAEIKWQSGKVTFLNIHNKEEFASIIVQENCQLDQITIKEHLSKESKIDGKEMRYLIKPKKSVAKMTSDDTMKFAESANASIKEVKTFTEYLFYNDEQQYTVLNIFSKIDAAMIFGTVLAIVISCVTTTIEFQNYKLYQMTKNKPVKLVLTRDFLERIRIQRCSKKRGVEKRN
ncbi:hypothetical protein ACH3XW_0725 [Acanthocheilonema viteae]